MRRTGNRIFVDSEGGSEQAADEVYRVFSWSRDDHPAGVAAGQVGEVRLQRSESPGAGEQLQAM